MACDHCQLTSSLDGRTVHVGLRLKNLRQLAWSDERNCFLYQCPECRGLWESCAYEKAASEITAGDARRWYPDSQIASST